MLGEPAWKLDLGYVAVGASPMIYDNSLFVLANFELHRIVPETGEVQWSVAVGSGLGSLKQNDGVLITSTYSRAKGYELVGVDASGFVKWRTLVAGGQYAVGDGSVFGIGEDESTVFFRVDVETGLETYRVPISSAHADLLFDGDSLLASHHLESGLVRYGLDGSVLEVLREQPIKRLYRKGSVTALVLIENDGGLTLDFLDEETGVTWSRRVASETVGIGDGIVLAVDVRGRPSLCSILNAETGEVQWSTEIPDKPVAVDFYSDFIAIRGVDGFHLLTHEGAHSSIDAIEILSYEDHFFLTKGHEVFGYINPR